MKITVLIRPEAPSQPRGLSGIKTSKTRQVKELPQCQAERGTRYYSDAKGMKFRCTMRARYDVEGVTMCQRHAGEVALAHLLEGSEK